MIEQPVSAFQVDVLRPYPRKLLVWSETSPHPVVAPTSTSTASTPSNTRTFLMFSFNTHHMFAVTLLNFSKRSAQHEGLSSPTSSFPLGDKLGL